MTGHIKINREAPLPATSAISSVSVVIAACTPHAQTVTAIRDQENGHLTISIESSAGVGQFRLTQQQENAVRTVMSIIQKGKDDQPPPFVPDIRGDTWTDGHDTFGITTGGDLAVLGGGEICHDGRQFQIITPFEHLPDFFSWLQNAMDKKKEDSATEEPDKTQPVSRNVAHEMSLGLYHALDFIKERTGVMYRGFNPYPISGKANANGISPHTHADIRFTHRHGNTVSGLLDLRIPDIHKLIKDYLGEVNENGPRLYSIGRSNKLVRSGDYYKCTRITDVVTGEEYGSLSDWNVVRQFGALDPEVVVVVMAKPNPTYLAVLTSAEKRGLSVSLYRALESVRLASNVPYSDIFHLFPHGEFPDKIECVEIVSSTRGRSLLDPTSPDVREAITQYLDHATTASLRTRQLVRYQIVWKISNGASKDHYSVLWSKDIASGEILDFTPDEGVVRIHHLTPVGTTMAVVSMMQRDLSISED